MIYIILLLIAVALIILEVMGKQKRKKRVAGNSKFAFDSEYIDKVDDILKNYELIYSLKERYVRKLSVTNTNKRRHNNAIVLLFMAASLIVTIIVAILIMSIMNMWYIVFLISIMLIFFEYYGFSIYINTQLKRIHKQFPLAIQTYTDIYITCRNVKVALNESYKEMPHEIGTVFEKLARGLSSGNDNEKHIKAFADDLEYVWGYAFSEILIMSYEGTGDISEDLLFLCEMVNDDLQSEEENKSEMASNKMMNVILNGITVFVFIVNIFANPIAKQLYLYTSTGNTIMMAWIFVVAIGIITTAVMEKI